MAVSCKSPKNFKASTDLSAFRCVKLVAGKGDEVEYAGVGNGEAVIGVTFTDVEQDGHVAVVLKGMTQTVKVEAAGTFAAGASLYITADGKVAGAASGDAIGTALDAATAAGDIIEMLPDNGAGSAPGADGINNYSATVGGVPFVVKQVCTAAGAENEVVIASFPRKAQIIDAFMHARDTNAANVTLKNGSVAITGATAKGTVDDARVAFGSIVNEQKTIDAEDTINATFSAAASVEIYILCLPLA